jgi:hypothetical protein
MPTGYVEKIERHLKVGTPIRKCMEAHGFEFNTGRANGNSARQKYSGVEDSVMDEENWDDSWWLAKLIRALL